jgi:NAD dependent epimerase/dehydratase family enzyme
MLRIGIVLDKKGGALVEMLKPQLLPHWEAASSG